MVASLRRAAMCAGLIVTIAGCSSSGGDGSAGESSGSPAPSTADSGATTAIGEVYKLFFDTNTSLAKSMNVLQHGPTFRATLISESKSPSAVDITAKVSAVRLVSNDVAKVTFTLYSGKNTLLPDTHGYAVRERGSWKVAAQTFCALLTLEGTAPPACKDKSITALHG